MKPTIYRVVGALVGGGVASTIALTAHAAGRAALAGRA